MDPTNTVTHGWSFTRIPSSFPDQRAIENDDLMGKRFKVDRVPTNVHSELIDRGEIKDPYKGLAEYQVQVRSIASDKQSKC